MCFRQSRRCPTFAPLLLFLIKETPEDKWSNLAALVLGVSAGSLFGVYTSPYTLKETTKFGEYAAAVSAFASGYVLGKIDGLITKLLSPEIMLQRTPGFRLITAASSFIIAMLITYYMRSY